MNDEIRPSTPTHSPRGSSREDLNRERGQGSEVTGTVVSQEGKLGILINKQFIALTTSLNAKVGDIVRVRIEQAGPESTVRVLRILGTTHAAPIPAIATQRTLRALFPEQTIRPLQDLFTSLQEVLDLSTAGEIPDQEVRADQPTIQSSLSTVSPAITELSDAISEVPASSRHQQIPAAYGARSDELRTISATEVPPASAAPQSPFLQTPRSSFLQSILSSLASETISPATKGDLSKDAVVAFLEDTVKRILPRFLNRENESTRSGGPDSPRAKRVSPEEISTLSIAMPSRRNISTSLSAVTPPADRSAPQSPLTAAFRFHQCAIEAQPLLHQYSTLFELLDQPSYLLTSLAIGPHIIPFEVSTFKDPPSVNRSEEEEKGSPSVQRGFSRVKLSIHLPSLGSVGIDIAYRGSEVMLKFTSPVPSVTEFLSQELPSFSKELEQEGYTLTSWFTERGQVAPIAPGWFQDLVAGNIVA